MRCEIIVKAELEKLGLQHTYVEIGEAEIEGSISEEQREQLNEALKKAGLELMEDRKSMLIEKIKRTIIEIVHYSDAKLKMNLSTIISDELKYDYTYLANLFSDAQDITIEKFYINQKIERVKELLLYNELNLTEIAYKLNYSSLAHLSHQFKKNTGLTPSLYKQLKKHKTFTKRV